MCLAGDRGRQTVVETTESQRTGRLRPVQHPGRGEDRGARGRLHAGDLLCSTFSPLTSHSFKTSLTVWLKTQVTLGMSQPIV